MKRYLVLLIALPLLFGCGSKKEAERNKAKADSLTTLLAQRDQTVNGFLSSFGEIQDNLNTIKKKEKLISIESSGKGELNKDAKDQINEDIKTIYDLLIKNKHIITSLNKKLKNSNLRIAKLEQMVASLSALLVEKGVTIDSLKERLAKLHIDVAHLSANLDSLKQVSQNKQQVIEQKTSELNTAYYIVGTKKELIEKKVITKEGGFIGIGKSAKLMNSFDKSNFIKVDITQFKSIPLNKKKADVLTNHPTDSYKIEGKDRAESLTIINPTDFWSISKYLVIVVE